MKMQQIDDVKIHHVSRGINDVTFQPELILVLTLPLTPVIDGIPQEEEDRLLGQMMREAMDRHLKDKKNG